MTWEDVGFALAPMCPRTILAVSCNAAASGPAQALFENIPSLCALGGSPATLTSTQAGIAALQLLAAAYGNPPDTDISTLATLFNAADTGGIVIWRRRSTFTAATDVDRLLVDVLAVLAKDLL